MKAAIITLSSVLLIAVIALGIEHSRSNRLSRAVASLDAAAKTQTSTLADQTANAAELQNKMGELAKALNNSTAQIASLKTSNSDLQRRLAPFERSEADKQNRQKLADQQPCIRSGKTVTFPRLLSVSGNALMLNAEFVSAIGRKLIFKTGLDRSGFDIDEIHPGALVQLGIDPDAAKESQAEIDSKKQAYEMASLMAGQEHLNRVAKANEMQQAQDAAQAKIDEKNRQQRVRESLLQQSADAESKRAEASVREANASLLRAAQGY